MIFSAFLLFSSLSLGQQEPSVYLPAYSAYCEPKPDGVRITEREGITGWTDPQQQIAWYGKFNQPGRLDVTLRVVLKQNDKVKLEFELEGQKRTREFIGTGSLMSVPLGIYYIKNPGYHRLSLRGVSKSGATFGDLKTLVMIGAGCEKAQFSIVERRNAASVHLWYPVESGAQVTHFYNEITPKHDPIWSYYMACGFSRGYFGIQVNSPTERRIIFSVWDSGTEAIDRNKVKPEDLVQLVAKGDGVYASGFGNEGTGGHSHLVYPWKLGDTFRFMVTAKPEGSTTTYSGYFFFPEKKAWGLIASFKAPKDGGYLKGLYSFNENFWGSNGQLIRTALFGPTYVKVGGTWTELVKAKFTHDGHGKEQRKDYDAKADGMRFLLSHGGFVQGTATYGAEFTRQAQNTPPSDFPH